MIQDSHQNHLSFLKSTHTHIRQEDLYQAHNRPLCHQRLLLHQFSYEVLINTEPGRDYVFLLYDNSLEIAILLFLDPSSTKLAAEVTNEILHGVESLLYNDEITISRKTINDFESLLNQLETKASPWLKTVIKNVKKDIRREVIFKQLGSKTIEY